MSHSPVFDKLYANLVQQSQTILGDGHGKESLGYSGINRDCGHIPAFKVF